MRVLINKICKPESPEECGKRLDQLQEDAIAKIRASSNKMTKLISEAASRIQPAANA